VMKTYTDEVQKGGYLMVIAVRKKPSHHKR